VTLYSAAPSYRKHKPAFKVAEICYQPTSKLINVIIYEDRHDVSAPLHLQFAYKPFMGLAMIHKIAEGHNLWIKEFYWKILYGDDAVLPDIDIRDTFTSPEIMIDVA
jgi:fatty acid synthase subunit alpha, fungi type